MSKVDARLDEWKRKLIDLTRRNRLLFFKPTRNSTLKVIEPSPAEVFQRLVVDEKSWRFLIPPEENEEQEQSGDNLNLPLTSVESERNRSGLSSLAHKANELVCQTREARKVETVLRNLHRRSRSDFEERGVRILHLAFGLLEWRENPQSDPARSPLVLVPVQISRGSANDPFELSITEEDIVLNPAIVVRLWKDFHINLPPLPDDWEEENLDSYLARIAEQISPQSNWRLHQECWIGLFSFHKLVIYQDLDSHAELIKQHQIIRALSQEPDATDVVNGTASDPRELDTLVSPKESYLIRDADSSQLASIEAVKRGVNLIIQGPPGTGKSQTIANLIAESIAAGRTVLFMSEKMAALEVVYKRVLEASLGHYCLELHSHKANKREVVAELYRCYLESLQPKTTMTELEFQQLTNRRRELNDYVHALHLVRQPLGKTAYDVLGELAELERVPFVPPGDIPAKDLTPACLDYAIQLARRLAAMWKVVAEGELFPWRGCTITSYGPDTHTTFQELIRTCEEARTRLEDEAKQIAHALGFPVAKQLSEAEWLLRTGEILSESPGAEIAWLVSSGFESFVSEAKQQGILSSRRRTLKDDLGQRYTDAFFMLPPTLKVDISRNLDSVSSTLGQNIRNQPRLVSERETILHWARDFVVCLKDWQRDATILSDLLGLPVPTNIQGLQRLLKIADLCESPDRPDAKWFDPVILEQVPEILIKLRRDNETRSTATSEILREYEESFLSLDLGQLIEAFSDRYASPFKWLRPGFYRLRARVRRCRRDGKWPRDILKDLRAARDLLQLEARILAESSHARHVLGTWYRGYDTDVARAEKAFTIAKRLSELTGGVSSTKLVSQACFGSVSSPELRPLADRLQERLAAWEKQTAPVNEILPLDRLPHTGLPLRQSPLEEVLAWAKELLRCLEAFVNHVDAVEAPLRFNLERRADDILADLNQLALLRDLESEMLRGADRLSQMYGSRFSGLDTDWDSVLSAIEWAGKLRDHLRNRTIPEQALQIACRSALEAPKIDALRDRVRKFHEASSEIIKQFAQESGFFTLSSAQRDFEALGQQLTAMGRRIDEIRDWIDYKTVESDFQIADLQKLHAEIINRPALQPGELPDVVRRALLQAWIDWLFKEEPALGRFRAQNHERLIAEFQELDRKHCQLGSHRVISEAERRKPKNVVLQPGGETAVLFREANKKKRHLPIRQLFAQIPNLLMRLKPCLLMSPLSVSQFLDPELCRFDLVIFDEASQICSEDAVGAIYRGQQLVVSGDNKQLPPTAFFEQGMSDEYEDQDAKEAFDVFDSILDECAAIGMSTGWLRWHYRSRHEDLIAFSNHRFYDNRLVTFPAAAQKHPLLGIEFVHVPDGVYDRGGRRDNQREADIVADSVVQHFFTHPKRSLGVVAFSVAQMNAIEDRIERLRRDRPELERYFADDRLEGFFVKNLENVQGDERDVIIFSVGYGKDQQRRLTMYFGPLNHEGGERRLNVAVTRAREKVIVVTSIRAADLDLSATNQPGVLALYHYLDFAERGPDALLLKHPGPTGEFETPLERDVAGAIRALGYQVVPQVGCSGYRIDIGVVDPTEPGRFIVGVECDGATYHSAYTARDRDRLRQEVLKKLGWRIHRVWAPDWVTRRETEIRHLQEAIEQARASVGSTGESSPGGDNPTPRQPTSEIKLPSDPEPDLAQQLTSELLEEAQRTVTPAAPAPITVRGEPPRLESGEVVAPWTVLYRASQVLTKPPRGVEFHDPNAREVLARMLIEVTNAEGPIHVELAARRLAKAWGLERVGGRMKKAITSAVNKITKGAAVHRRGKFLWPKRNDFKLQARRPDPADDDSRRPIEFIPDEEMEVAMRNIVEGAMSITPEDLVTQVSRVFGFDRTGETIRERIEWSLQQMIQEGTLVRKGDRISLG